MTTKTLRPADLKAEEPAWEGKWKNLHFLKNGQTHLGEIEWNNEAEAKSFMLSLVPRLNYPKHKFVGQYSKNFQFYVEDYSHTIQIPWKEKD